MALIGTLCHHCGNAANESEVSLVLLPLFPPKLQLPLLNSPVAKPSNAMRDHVAHRNGRNSSALVRAIAGLNESVADIPGNALPQLE
jgi:hypothetical protein